MKYIYVYIYIYIVLWLPPSSGISEVHKVRLSLRSCIIKVLSLYDSSLNESSSEIASSKACFASRKQWILPQRTMESDARQSQP
ncbi:hypothetical protein Hanom_Chr06g00541381 [Helianthus anomalus]